MKQWREYCLKQEAEMNTLAEFLGSANCMPSQLDSIEQLADYGYVDIRQETCFLKSIYYVTQSRAKKVADEKSTSISCIQYHLVRMPVGGDQQFVHAMKLFKYLQMKRLESPEEHVFLLRLNQMFVNRSAEQRELWLMYDRFHYSVSLKHRLWNDEPAKVEEAKSWALQLASAVDRLSLYGISNRYIRPETVLLSRGEIVKIANFDMAISFNSISPQVQAESANILLCSLSRSLLDHLPPECFHRTYDVSHVDMWSVGTVLVSCLTNCSAFTLDVDGSEGGDLIAQWKQSGLRVTLVDEFRTLLDDIFQPSKNRMIAFDMKNDVRLLKSTQYNRQVKMNQYYRIDNTSKLNQNDARQMSNL